ncbi:MAG: DsrE family protein [bacterium]
MQKAVIIVLADTESLEALGRVANALMTVQEFKEAGDEVQLIFDGAGTKWVGQLSDPGHKYHDVYQQVRDKVGGVCTYCADAFGVSEQVRDAGAPFADAYQGHPSLRRFVSEGYQVITF